MNEIWFIGCCDDMLCWYGNSSFKLTEDLILVCVIPNPWNVKQTLFYSAELMMVHCGKWVGLIERNC